ncbi:hypothetical protein [uncultured Draconibacterium sp.]|uniref:hypothetical protein n=1 Tax=uncultured Draconibacterium sp. TaxID=1573823 RepID=UPI0029C082FB|nr:hypothetical protein [uncultured Draconibacterium sp.]
MNLIRKHTNLLFVLILPVYLYIVQTSIQNKHTHVYANGIVVTHSHPTDDADGPNNDHKHSQREINLYSSLHSDLYETPELTAFNFEAPVIHFDYIIYNEQEVTIPVSLHTIPRAPPA